MREINFNQSQSLVHYTADVIRKKIDRGDYGRNEKLLSINTYSKQHSISRDTIEKAYILLKNEGYIRSVSGKGYYVVGNADKKLKVLLIFNKLSAYKKIIYDNIVAELGNKASVNLCVHHYNPATLDEIISQNLGSYHYYVVMPHFFTGCNDVLYKDVLKKVPENQLILLDKDVPGLTRHSSIFQDFERDIFEALVNINDKLEKYHQLALIFPPDRNHPEEVKDGVIKYCKEHKKKLKIVSSSDTISLKKGTAYIVLKEGDLAHLIKMVRKAGLELGKDIGIISFNETIFKELLDISVITTDFEAMGKATALNILNNTNNITRNPFKVILRSSL